MKINKDQARAFLLNRHHLISPRTIDNEQDVLKLISGLGCIQYDPLDQAGRNADLVLQSRVKNYSPDLLFDLLYTKRKLIDYWDKNMSIWPAGDWPFFKRYRDNYIKHHSNRSAEFDNAYSKINEYLAENEKICSSDIRGFSKTGWSWSPTSVLRAALESLFHSGKLVIHSKKGTRKYYAPTEKILPAALLDNADPYPDDDDFYSRLVLRRIRSVGMLGNRASDAWLGIMNFNAGKRNRAFADLLDRNEIKKITVSETGEEYYICSEHEPLLDIPSFKPQASFIAPLDNFIWDRNLISSLFDFYYRWEVYTPAAKRVYGYYTIPVLYGSSFTARFEPKFDKKSRILNIQNWWWEDNVSADTDTIEALSGCLRDFAGFCGAEKIIYNGNKKKNTSWLKSVIL